LIWNAAVPARAPEAIVTAASVKDVQRYVRFAREHALQIAVRSSGHNYFGAALRNGGLLLDLGPLNTFDIDVQRRRARVGPAVKSGAFLSALIAADLAFPVGHAADVGLGGFILNGGLGWNTSRWGPACMSVIGMEMVLPNGKRIYADAEEHPDLFWAARGAGPGFFAAITAYDVTVQPLPQIVTTETLYFPVASIPLTAPWLTQLAMKAPTNVELAINIGSAPDAPLPQSSSALSITTAMFADTPDVHHWRSLLHQPPAGVTIIGHKQHQSISFDRLLQATSGIDARPRMTGDASWSNATIEQLLSTVSSLVETVPSEKSYVMLQPIKMPLNHPDAAFSLWGSIYVAAYSYWQDAADDERCKRWLVSIRDAVAPLCVGPYVGEADLSIEPNRVSRCFSKDAWERLVSLKRRHDRNDVFFWYLES
jgi:hypothetical protein